MAGQGGREGGIKGIEAPPDAHLTGTELPEDGWGLALTIFAALAPEFSCIPPSQHTTSFDIHLHDVPELSPHLTALIIEIRLIRLIHVGVTLPKVVAHGPVVQLSDKLS